MDKTFEQSKGTGSSVLALLTMAAAVLIALQVLRWMGGLLFQPHLLFILLDVGLFYVLMKKDASGAKKKGDAGT